MWKPDSLDGRRRRSRRPGRGPAGAVLLAALACAGASCVRSAPDPVDVELRARFESLHRRLYDVYALGGDRDALWTFLEGSFAGEALTREYVEHFTALRRMDRERTSIRVLAVDYEEVAVHREDGGWRVDADWSVGGVVTHQGHRHPRINRYRASYRLAAAAAPVAGSARTGDLRIVGTTLRSLERVGSARATGFPLDAMPGSARGSLSLSDLLRSGAAGEAVAGAGAAEEPDESPDRREDPRP
jgi:hypothetical protein